jgi:hypothetical protein
MEAIVGGLLPQLGHEESSAACSASSARCSSTGTCCRRSS